MKLWRIIRMNVHSRQELDPARAQRIKCSAWNKRRGQRQLLRTICCCSVVSNSLQHHGLQQARLPCPLPTPRACTNSCHRVGDAIQSSHPLSPISPPAFNLSQHQGLFQWVGSLHQVAKVLELSFGISPSNEYSGLISFRTDWFVLLATQRTLKSLLQHHSSKLSILQHSAFFMVELSHPCMTTGKTIIWLHGLLSAK